MRIPNPTVALLVSAAFLIASLGGSPAATAARRSHGTKHQPARCFEKPRKTHHNQACESRDARRAKRKHTKAIVRAAEPFGESNAPLVAPLTAPGAIHRVSPESPKDPTVPGGDPKSPTNKGSEQQEPVAETPPTEQPQTEPPATEPPQTEPPATEELQAPPGEEPPSPPAEPTGQPKSYYAPHPGRVYSAPNSVWNTAELANAETEPSSETLVSTLAYWGAHNNNGINSTSYSAPIYTVAATQPTTKVILDWQSPPLNAALAAVPIPPNATVAPGTDEHMVIYQPETNQTWEFWHMREGLLPPTTPSFTATVNPGGHLPVGDYYYRLTALSAAGETTPSEAFYVAVTEPASTVALNFKGVIYGQGYKVYRGTAPNETEYVGTIKEATNEYGTILKFLDTGAVAPGAAPPTRNTAATPGQWHAGWGGRIVNTTTDPGYYRLLHPAGQGVLEEPSWGATASSLPIADGMITIGDLEQGHIDHALQLLLPTARAAVHAFPAQRTDGGETTTNSVPEGARFVLSPAYKCALQATPFMRMVCAAAQEYGFIVNDQTGSGMALRAEDPGPLIQSGGTSPYHGYYTDADSREWRPYQMLAAFPWSQLHLLPMQLETENQYHA